MGKFVAPKPDALPLQDRGVTACNECPEATYQDSTGESACKVCRDAYWYQDQRAAASCKRCPKGYQNRTSIAPDRQQGYPAMTDVCQICPAGKYNDKDSGEQLCIDCPAGTYSNVSGSTSCLSCTEGKITLSAGSDSSSLCICPEDRFDPGTGACKPCGRCSIGEYVVDR